MLISIPNDDDNEEDTENLIEHLKKIKARSQFLSYKADKFGMVSFLTRGLRRRQKQRLSTDM
jgi:hypothetical protein